MILCVNRLEQTMLDVKKVHSVRTKRNTLSLSLSQYKQIVYSLSAINQISYSLSECVLVSLSVCWELHRNALSHPSCPMRRCPSVPHDLDTSVDPTRHGTALLAASTLTRTRRHRARRSQHGAPFNPFPAQESVLLMQPLPNRVSQTGHPQTETLIF